MGGSQGAEIFGKIIPSTIKMLNDKGHTIEIKQQCIKQQKNSLIEFYKINNIKSNIFDFTNNILDLIKSSDLAISRCGASTTAELVNTLTPFIAVPLPYSMDNHQHLNAQHYERKGCCWMLEQNNFTSVKLHEIKFTDQVELFYNAECIIGLHGGGFANLAFCKPATKVVELRSANAGTAIENLAKKNDLNYNSIIVEAKKIDKFDYPDPNQQGSIQIPISSLTKVLEN